MLTMYDGNLRLRRAQEDELLVTLRRRVDLFDAIGVSTIAILIPVTLSNYVSLTRTIPWTALVLLTIAAWMHHRLPWSSPEWVAPAGLWGSSILWAVLPWLDRSALVHDEVAVILLAVCGFGLATDALFVPQTVRLPLSPMMLFYASSYVVVFLLDGRWIATVALIVFTSHLVVGSAGIDAIKRRILELEVAANERDNVDELTGLASRAATVEHVDAKLRDGCSVICVAIDIDHFSAINEHLGARNADAVLRAFGHELRELLPEFFVARIRGDRFLAIGEQPLSIGQLEALPAIELHPRVADLEVQTITVSAGIATSETADSVNTLFRQAGLALRQAKRRGRRQIVHATPRLLAESMADRELAERARTALNEGELVAWAQPIVGVEARAWRGFELLARWPQPDGTFVTPDRFVPVIEAQGGSRLLGHLMLQEAVTLLARLRDMGHTDIFVTVNLSALHLTSDDLPTRISRLVEAAGVNPGCLILEMTESQRLPDPAVARRAFARLRDLGVGIASDDVGSGWSSLNQLMSTPFTHMKVDRGLINGAQRRDASDLLMSLRQLAEGAGQVAVAEGIETEAELALIRKAGFRLAQGYFFARPMAIDDAIEELSSGSFSADIA